jgi:hypothetical protein
VNNEDPRRLYLDNLRTMVRKLYRLIKDHGIMPAENHAYIDGYMLAGRRLGVVTQDELKQLMEEENKAVFGMSVEKRRKAFRPRRVSVDDQEYLDIPTMERRGVNLW